MARSGILTALAPAGQGRVARARGRAATSAPEQARGRGLSPATDVWGLGMTLVEALTRTAPYGDEATWDSRRRWPLVHRRAPTAPAGLDELPEPVRDLLRACLSLDPAARPLLAQVRTALEPLRSPAAPVHDVVAPLPTRR